MIAEFATYCDRISQAHLCRSMVAMAKGETMSAQIPRTIDSIAFVFAILASALCVSVPANTARAVDCLTAPQSSARQNSHWYYRTDRVQHRKCWYLRAANQPSQQGAVQAVREALPTDSLASFKDYVAQHASANLSDEEVEKLYSQFLEWRRNAKN
jgi:hypothetical protein